MRNGVDAKIFFNQIGHDVRRHIAMALEVLGKFRGFSVGRVEDLAFDDGPALPDERDHSVVGEVEKMFGHDQYPLAVKT